MGVQPMKAKLTPWQAGTDMRNKALHLIRACVGQRGVPRATREDLLEAAQQWDAVEHDLAMRELSDGILTEAGQARFLNK